MREFTFASPLFTVISDARVHRILDEIRTFANAQMNLRIPKDDVKYIQDSFSQAIMKGEKGLHMFSLLLMEKFSLHTKCNICLNVFGRCANPSHPRLLKQEAWFKDEEREDLLSKKSDTLLASAFAPWCIECNKRTKSIASNTDYFPVRTGENKLVFLRTRIKTTSNIAYKIADMVLDIDLTFKRDKVYNRYSQQIKDLYGIKCVVAQDSDVTNARDLIASMPGIEILEEKNYTGAHKKKSGFEAYKMVVNVQHQMLEIQIQSNRMYDEERLNWSTSHTTYKEAQMQQRQLLGKEYIRLYEALIKLLSEPSPYQEISRIELGYSQKGLDDEF